VLLGIIGVNKKKVPDPNFFEGLFWFCGLNNRLIGDNIGIMKAFRII
jgi:hypothetical protein